MNPLNAYGRSNAIAESCVLAAHLGALVVRSSAFFGPWDRYNFVTVAFESLRGGGSFTAADDVVVSPTYVPDLAHASLDLLQDGERGIWHLANRGAVSWAELARRSAALVPVDASRLVARELRTRGRDSAPSAPISVSRCPNGATHSRVMHPSGRSPDPRPFPTRV